MPHGTFSDRSVLSAVSMEMGVMISMQQCYHGSDKFSRGRIIAHRCISVLTRKDLS